MKTLVSRIFFHNVLVTKAAVFTLSRFYRYASFVAKNHGSECHILWDTFRSHVAVIWFGLVMITDGRMLPVSGHDGRIAKPSSKCVFPYGCTVTAGDLRSSSIISKPGLNGCVRTP